MTGLLLADGVTRGLYKIDAPVHELLGGEVKLDERITLRRLSTHTSGLPRVPTNMFPNDPRDPYASYTEERLLTYLGDLKMQSEPGTDASYSNLGVGLLGYALAEQAGVSFPELLDQRLLRPMGMKSTTVALNESQSIRMAGPHAADTEPAHLWNIGVLAGAGGVRSNVQDMLTYAAAQIEPSKTPLADAIRLSQTVQTRTGEAAFDEAMGLGWFMDDQGTTLAHDGGTGGFRAMLKISLEDQTAVVVLSNTASTHAKPLARQIIQLVEGKTIDPVDLPKTINVEQAVLEQYVGRYALLDLGHIEIERTNGKLYTRQTGQKPIRLFANAKDSFRNRVAEATIRFDRDEAGEVSGLILIQGQTEFACPRVETEQAE